MTLQVPTTEVSRRCLHRGNKADNLGSDDLGNGPWPRCEPGGHGGSEPHVGAISLTLAQPLGRVRVGGRPSDLASGVRFVIDAVVAVAEGSQGRLLAPALLLRPRLRRAFDEGAVRAAYAAWSRRRTIPGESLLLPGTDEEGFLPAAIAFDTSAWRSFSDDTIQPLLDLSSLAPARVSGILRTSLARRPWALIGAADLLEDIYPLVGGMDPVDAAFASVLLFRAAAPACEEQQPAGRPHDLAPPPADIDLLLHLETLGVPYDRDAILAKFAVAARLLLPEPHTGFRAEDLEGRATAWARALRDVIWADFGGEDRAILRNDPEVEGDEALTLGPFRPMLIPDIALAAPLPAGADPALQTDLLRGWLASGRVRRLLFVVAAVEPTDRLEGPGAELLAPAGGDSGAHRPLRATVSAEVEV